MWKITIEANMLARGVGASLELARKHLANGFTQLIDSSSIWLNEPTRVGYLVDQGRALSFGDFLAFWGALLYLCVSYM